MAHLVWISFNKIDSETPLLKPRQNKMLVATNYIYYSSSKTKPNIASRRQPSESFVLLAYHIKFRPRHFWTSLVMYFTTRHPLPTNSHLAEDRQSELVKFIVGRWLLSPLKPFLLFSFLFPLFAKQKAKTTVRLHKKVRMNKYVFYVRETFDFRIRRKRIRGLVQWTDVRKV